MPVEDPVRLCDGFDEVPGQVLYALAAVGPEGGSVPSGSGCSDETKEGGATAESFPSLGSTVMSAKAAWSAR